MNWLEILYQIFQIAIIPLIGAGTLYLIALIKAKRKELQDKTDNEIFKEYLEILENTISTCVMATTQTYVNELKAQGKFDLEAQKIALQKSYDAIINILTEDAKKYLNKGIADLENYILNRIEQEVVVTKRIYN